MPAYHLHGVRVFECPVEGNPLRNDRDAAGLIGTVWQNGGAAWIAIPTQCLTEDFFRLSTRLAGGIIQKFLNYRLRLAIVGDISWYVDASSALRDFVAESNRGDHVWFVANLDELDRRLKMRDHRKRDFSVQTP